MSVIPNRVQKVKLVQIVEISALKVKFLHMLLTNHMVFLMQFGVNKHLQILSKTCVILFLFGKKLTCAYLFQIALEIMILSI